MPASKNVELRVNESLKINDTAGVTDIAVGSDDYCFYACGDIHNEYQPKRFIEYMRRLRNDSTAAFGLLLGDIANRKGAIVTAREASMFDSATHLYNTPLLALAGNHDLFFGQWDDFKNCFGSSTYYFTVTTPNFKDLYIMLDSGGGCHGSTQLEWLEKVLANRKQYRHCVVCTHVNLFRTDLSQTISGNLPIEETYRLINLMTIYDVDLVLQGHDHHRKLVRYGDVAYQVLDCLKDSAPYVSYMTASVESDIQYIFNDDF
ncbi:MAG: metallophosphoesterase [Bacteroidales bacterium]|nr:metallophosphoesterase [Bacteroidales bacterium]